MSALAWAAGLFEGEGTVSLQCVNGRYYLGLSASMHPRDRDVLERLAAVLGGSVAGPHKNGMCRWSTTGKNALAVVRQTEFVDNLGWRRTARIAEFVAVVEAQPPPMSSRESGRRAGIASGKARRAA